MITGIRQDKMQPLEGTNNKDVRLMVLDMHARLLLDMLWKGIKLAMINPSVLVRHSM